MKGTTGDRFAGPDAGRTTALAVVASLCLLAGGAAALFVVRPARDVAPGVETEPAADTGWTVELSPVGEVHFDAVPERIVTLDANYNDLLVALGRQSDLVATGYVANWYDGFYGELEGAPVEVDPSAFAYLYGGSGDGFDKETLYALDADVHHIDPLRLARSRAWTPEAIDEVARRVGPFLANRYSRTWSYRGDEPYTYYELWDLMERVAGAYRDEERVRALRAEHEALVARIAECLPPRDARPRVGLVMPSERSFLPFGLSRPGFGTAQYRAVGAVDAFASILESTYGDAGSGTRFDLETLVALDPDVLIVPWAIYDDTRYQELRALGDDPLARRVKAIANGRVYPGGSPLQGPLFHLFQTEMAAKQIYPDLFGPYRPDQDYPRDERLFERERIARILGGGDGTR